MQIMVATRAIAYARAQPRDNPWFRKSSFSRTVTALACSMRWGTAIFFSRIYLLC